MREAGYGPEKPLTVLLTSRDQPTYRDTSVILLDQLSKIYIKSEMKLVDTALWPNILAKRAYMLAVRSRGPAFDDPDIAFYEGYSCHARTNYTGYCDKEMEALFERQSATVDVAARTRLVREIDKKLHLSGVRPTITFSAIVYCRRPYVKGYVPSLNNQFSHLRMEGVWLDK
jgi:ABC-type transport system substrate-binding protein